MTFAPAAAQTYGGLITVNSDAASGANTLQASGQGTPPSTYTLTVDSSNPGSGVSISVNPSDNQGNSSGVTSSGGVTPTLTFIYNQNTQVTVTAPLTVSGNSFSNWQLVFRFTIFRERFIEII
ncbi:MAG: hypothetical protein KGS61_09240, partial [Verrucomicrobia bacterium]|nr:hypothetical protein [Verrucomicrobiota bacterium]